MRCPGGCAAVRLIALTSLLTSLTCCAGVSCYAKLFQVSDTSCVVQRFDCWMRCLGRCGQARKM